MWHHGPLWRQFWDTWAWQVAATTTGARRELRHGHDEGMVDDAQYYVQYNNHDMMLRTAQMCYVMHVGAECRCLLHCAP
eukprot:6627769-Pyramimonas_sp.AAC.1